MRLVEIAGELTDGHAMARGQRIQPYEGREAGIRHVALELLSAERIRSIEDDHGQTDPRRRAHGQRHGPREGVVARAHVLEIDDERLDPLQRGGWRLQPFAVPFMALFERNQLPSRSALSRFLAALTEAPVEALRTLNAARCSHPHVFTLPRNTHRHQGTTAQKPGRRKSQIISFDRPRHGA